ncbi:hypothetical protein [Paenibacillus sp. ACRRY]|uniref:hypothetical protein n=1 Tax=Paenibacillus sp. ACRRY TaxID=2918208 RepID=UPI001EF68810|nr:hypothetical protein [Paenibacillus sp. ACRRY]MCG7385059.1 hypothetical protein [Paenibacillus sp. ACRRY]
MQMQVRIKASDKFEDRFALSLSGGRFVDGAYPKFVFENQTQRNNYDRIRREMKGANEDGKTNPKSNPEARTVSRKYRRSGEFRI